MWLFLEGIAHHWDAHLHMQVVRYNPTAFDEVTDNCWFLGWKVVNQEKSLFADRNDLKQMILVLEVTTVVPSEPVLFYLSLLLVVKRGEYENESLYKQGVSQAR